MFNAASITKDDQRQSLYVVPVKALAAAAQNNRIARLDAQNGGVDGHVGARLVNHGNHAQRHAHAAHKNTIGALPLALCGPHGIGQIGNVTAGGAHFIHNSGRERKAVKTGFVLPGGTGCRKVLGIGGQNFGLPFLQQFCQPQQGLRFGIGVRLGYGPGCFLCPRSEARHFFCRRHANSLC